MKNKLKAFGLIAVLLVGSLSQAGCGNDATLARVGNVAVQLAAGFEGEVNSLIAAGLLRDQAKIDRLKQRVSAAKVSASALNTFLLSLREVDQANKAQITQKIAELTAIISGVLINQDAFGLSEDTGVVIVLRYATVSLNQLALVIAALNPPPVGVASGGAAKGIPVEKIKVEFTEPPPVVKKWIQ